MTLLSEWDSRVADSQAMGTFTSMQPDDAALCVAGLALVQPDSPAQNYAARWYRAWEGQLYSQARRASGQRSWSLSRFAGESTEHVTRSAYRETLAAVAQAAKLACADADRRWGRRGARERMALLYSDFWGRGSHLEQAFNWRDAFDFDVIPKFLLRDHAIDGYSCKLQSGRAGIAQGLQLAADLLQGGDIDIVMLGGLFRFYPALGFSEAWQGHCDERSWLGRGGRHPAAVVERAGFSLLRSASSVSGLRGNALLIEAPRYLQLPRGPAAATQALASVWSELMPTGSVFGGHYPSSLLERVESGAAGVEYINVASAFGDSGGLNPLLALQQVLQRADRGQSTPALLSMSDASGGTWLSRCQPLATGGQKCTS